MTDNQILSMLFDFSEKTHFIFIEYTMTVSHGLRSEYFNKSFNINNYDLTL